MFLNKYLSFVFLILFLFVSCKELTGAYTGANDIKKEEKRIGGVDAIIVTKDKYLLEGTMENGGNSGHNFRVRFKLPEGEKISFFFFMSKDFSGGIKYEFFRKNNEVNLTMFLNGKKHSVKLNKYQNEEYVDMDIDVHNDHTDVHLLAWDHQGPHKDSEECTFDGGCLYNSEDFAFDHWLGVGRASGTFWGFEGKKDLIDHLEGPLPAISNA